MSKFKIFGEDVLKNYQSHLQLIYKVDGLDSAKAYLENIIRAADKHPELYDGLLLAIMELPIVKQIQKEVENNGGREDIRGEG